VQKSAGRVLASNFWDQDGSLLIMIIFQLNGHTINAEYCSSLLMLLKDNLKEKRSGKIIKRVFFLHDNAAAHRSFVTNKKLA
jgi:hypothetical protein